MTTRALIFELFGTLLRPREAEYASLVKELADVLSVSRFEFGEAWREVVERRETSGGGTVEEDLEEALRGLNAFTHLDQRRAAIDLIYGFTRSSIEPETAALVALSHLRAQGFHLGVVANGTPLVRRLWAESPLAAFVDRAAFSCDAGVRLPDATLYRFAAERLGVPAEECVVVTAPSGGAGVEAAGLRIIEFSSFEALLEGIKAVSKGR